MNENNLKCPHCGEMWNDKECEVCGFADVVETLVPCSHCEDMMPDWAEVCIKCWHNEKKG